METRSLGEGRKQEDIGRVGVTCGGQNYTITNPFIIDYHHNRQWLQNLRIMIPTNLRSMRLMLSPQSSPLPPSSF